MAGPMRGLPEFNFPEFHRQAARLRAAGYVVCNPAEHDETFKLELGREPTIRECLAYDTEWICRHADGIALLHRWQESFGAKAEVALGDAIGIPHQYVVSWIQDAERAAA